MIAHVAQAGEGRGRVVLHVTQAAPNPVAIEAAVRVARAFQSEIESLFVESEQLIELSRHPFARQISWSGKSSRGLSTASIERHFRFASAEFHDAIAARAVAAEVPCRSRVVRGDPVDALAAACAECGPWNVIALAEPFGAASQPSLHQLLDSVIGTTGLLLVGPNARRTGGSIVLALDEPEGLSSMLVAAERLSAIDSTETIAALLALDDASLAELEGQARLVLADRDGIGIAVAQVVRGAAAETVEILRRLGPGLVIARFGSALLNNDADVRTFAASLECPLLMLR
jgi:hypothetical protein